MTRYNFDAISLSQFTLLLGRNEHVFVNFIFEDGISPKLNIPGVIGSAITEMSKRTTDETITICASDVSFIENYKNYKYLATDQDKLLKSCVRHLLVERFGYERVIIERVKPNRAQCLTCDSIIQSTYRHDFVSCTCGGLSLDGGMDYIRVICKDFDAIKWLDWPELEDQEHK